MSTMIAFFFALLGMAISAPQYGYEPPTVAPVYKPAPVYNTPAPVYKPAPSYKSPQVYEEPAKYDFSWEVKDQYSGNDFGQNENRDGDQTQGSYYVQLPDGRLQRVNYYVNGDSGFIAEVSYEGQASYPRPQVNNAYAPPKNQYN